MLGLNVIRDNRTSSIEEKLSSSDKNNSHVVILANSLQGLYSFRFELVQKLIGDRNQVSILAPHDEISSKFIQLGCIFIPVSISRRGTNPFHDYVLFHTYIKHLKHIYPTVVLTYTIKPNIYGGLASKLLHIPYIANITGLGSAVKNKGPLQAFTLFLYRNALSKAQKVFFQNKENQLFFEEKGIALGKHGLLPGSGVNLTKFQPLRYPPDDTIEFVFISRIMKEKGIDHYLEMAKVIKAKYPNTRFHICGFCEESYEGILHKMQEERIIQYHGMVKDVREIHKKTHCTVLPSYHEGMANVLLEAAACGRPVLASDIPGCKESFDNGVSGFGFESRSTISLIQAIEQFITIPYEQKVAMGISGRKKVEDEFDRQIVVRAYIKEIASIIATSRREGKIND
jgi:galacturonosyltransferase